MSDKAALDADNVRLAVAIAPVVLANKDVILANKDKVPGWATKADGTPRLHIPIFSPSSFFLFLILFPG